MKKYYVITLLMLCMLLTACGKNIQVTISVTEDTWADGGSSTSTTDTLTMDAGAGYTIEYK